MPMAREAARESALILQRLGAWIQSEPRWEKDIVLVGGWAVHALAPYYFSVDIDLIAKSNARSAMLKLLPSWGLSPSTPAAGVSKHQWERSAGVGQPMILEVFGTGKRTENTFERDTRLSIPWKEALLHSQIREVVWDDPPLRPRIRTCDPGLLLVYKVKALDDRTHLKNESGAQVERLEAKRAKDAKDIWALLRVLARTPDLEVVRDHLSRLPFLEQVLRSAPSVRGVVDVPDQGTVRAFHEEIETFLSRL